MTDSLKIPFNRDKSVQYYLAANRTEITYTPNSEFAARLYFVNRVESSPPYFRVIVFQDTHAFISQVKIADLDIFITCGCLDRGVTQGVFTYKYEDGVFSLIPTSLATTYQNDLTIEDYSEYYLLLYKAQLKNLYQRANTGDVEAQRGFASLQQTITSDIQSRGLPLSVKTKLLKRIVEGA